MAPWKAPATLTLNAKWLGVAQSCGSSEDGKEVKEGDKLVELDASALEDQISTQKIAYNKARSTMIQAEKTYEVAKISGRGIYRRYFQERIGRPRKRQSRLPKKTFVAQRIRWSILKACFSAATLARWSLRHNNSAVKRSQLELNSANTAKNVLVKYTRRKTLEDLESQVETAKATMESDKAAFELEEAKLRRLESQLEQCMIYAPQDGMVVFANERGGRFGQSSVAVEERGHRGGIVKPFFDCPTLSKMQVKVTVHETKVEDLRRNMRARINIQGRETEGVHNLNRQSTRSDVHSFRATSRNTRRLSRLMAR